MKTEFNPLVDKYLVDGCMRCKYGGTPQCKVIPWREELETLRQIVLETGLKEEIKWGMPCYTMDGKNIVMVSAFKNYAALSFLKGVLLEDTHQILEQHGENSQVHRFIKFVRTEEITGRQEVLKAYIKEAMEIEKSGARIEFKKKPEPIPSELTEAFDEDPVFKSAFFALTPGRQRGYIIYFSQPKQSQTRVSRIEKYKSQILHGVGLNDKYRS